MVSAHCRWDDILRRGAAVETKRKNEPQVEAYPGRAEGLGVGTRNAGIHFGARGHRAERGDHSRRRAPTRAPAGGDLRRHPDGLNVRARPHRGAAAARPLALFSLREVPNQNGHDLRGCAYIRRHRLKIVVAGGRTMRRQARLLR